MRSGRQEVQHLAEWCADDLVLNTIKIKEVIIDSPLHQRRGGGEGGLKFKVKFLGTHIKHLQPCEKGPAEDVLPEAIWSGSTTA